MMRVGKMSRWGKLQSFECWVKRKPSRNSARQHGTTQRLAPKLLRKGAWLGAQLGMEPCWAGWVIQLCARCLSMWESDPTFFHVRKQLPVMALKCAEYKIAVWCLLSEQHVHLLPKFVFQFKRYSYASSYIQLGSLNPLSIWLNCRHLIVEITSFHLKVHLYFRI